MPPHDCLNRKSDDQSSIFWVPYFETKPYGKCLGHGWIHIHMGPVGFAYRKICFGTGPLI